MILVNVLLGFSQFFRAIPIMNPLPWFMIHHSWGYKWPGLLLQVVFFRPCKTTSVHYWVYGATNKATWCVKLLPTTVSAYHVDCGCFCTLLKIHCCCLSPCGWYSPPSASHPPPIHTIRDITAVGKKLSQNPTVSARW